MNKRGVAFLIIVTLGTVGFLIYQYAPYPGSAKALENELFSSDQNVMQKGMLALHQASPNIHNHLAQALLALYKNKSADSKKRLQAIGMSAHLTKADPALLSEFDIAYANVLLDPSDSIEVKRGIPMRALGSSGIIAPLIKSYGKDIDPETKKIAHSIIYTLVQDQVRGGKLQPEVINAFVKGLKDPDPSVSEQCRGALGWMGGAAIPRLAEILKSERDPAVQIGILSAFEQCVMYNQALVFDAIIPVLNSPNAGVRQSACTILGGCGSRAIPSLVEKMNDPEKTVRLETMHMLGWKLGRYPEIESAVPRLKIAATEPDEEIKKGAMEALKFIKEAQDRLRAFKVKSEEQAQPLADQFLKSQNLNWGHSSMVVMMERGETHWYVVEYSENSATAKSVYINRVTGEAALTPKETSKPKSAVNKSQMLSKKKKRVKRGHAG